jgi:hypothetical protein
MKKSKFKNKYILAEGYPWFYGIEVERTNMVGMNKNSIGVHPCSIIIPPELHSKELPKYQLILKRL